MKKKLSLILVIISIQSFSQLSITIDNKYGFKMPGAYAQLYYSGPYAWGYGNTSSNASSNTIESKKYNFGNGFQTGISLRYGFKKGFGIDLGGSYLLGSKSQTTDKYTSSSSSNSSNSTEEYKSRIYRVNFGLSVIGEGKIAPAVKMGCTMGMGKILWTNKSTQTSTQYSYNPNPPYNTYTMTTTDTYESESKFYGGISWGFYAAAGVSYKANDNVSLLLCLDIVSLNFSPKKYILTKSTKNGTDELSKMLKSEKEVEFVENYTDVGAPPNNVSASQFSKLSLPLSSFGPSFSIVFTIGKKKEVPKETTNVEKQ